jgi:hypothetical protein
MGINILMKRNFTVLIVAVIMIAFASCKDTEASDVQHIEEMKDTIFKTFPTVVGITIRVEESSQLYVTIGDAHLYKADDVARQKEANRIGVIALHIFGKDNELEKGKLTVTKNEHTEEENPADGITTNINLDSLRKSNP